MTSEASILTPFRVAVVGSLDASVLAEVVAGFPEQSGHAVVIPAPDGDQLINALRSAARFPVTEVRHSVKLEADRVFVIPSDLDGWVVGDEIHVEPGTLPRAPVDRLMRTAADQIGRGSAGIVLGGPGSDGLIGIKRIKEAGGITIAQSMDRPASMPAHLMAAAGVADLVLPPSQIGARLVELARAEEQRNAVATDESAEAATVDKLGENLRDILTFVRVRSGHDFSAYKRATLFRRVARRMQVCQVATMAAYHQYLRDDPNEIAHLLRDFLISVTNFFRDPEAFDALQHKVIPKLFEHKTSTDQIRVWIAGCATGEEPYSIAMLLCEYARTLDDPPTIQVFATDIDENALAVARTGRYPDTIALDVSAERLMQFFTAEAGVYQVSKELREMVLFSPHNVLRDPPFSRLDLISCRNLMIYLNRDAQDRVLNVFHFALNAEGILLLGSSESAESSPLFSSTDPKQRVFVRRPATGQLSADALGTATRWRPPAAVIPPLAERAPTTSGELHHRIVEQFAPPSILVNEELDVLHVSENAGRFLRMAGGEPTRQLFRLIHPDLRIELRTAIHAARQSGRGFDTRVVRIVDDGQQRAVEIRVRALDLPELGNGALLVMFDELATTDGASIPERSTLEPVVREIEDELRRTKDQLRSTIEQYETSLEELKASNEELQAINEELRSATEELETSKEELQSVNEELTTLNHELKSKVDEVTRANSDLQNLMTSTDIAVVFLDRQLHVKRFTPRAQELFNIIPSDIGRPLAHVTHQIDNVHLSDLAKTVVTTLRTVEREVKSLEGKRYLLRMLPYRSLEDRIEGVVFTLIEVTDLRDALEGRRQSEAALATSQERLRTALRDAPMVVLVLDADIRVTWGYAFGAEIERGAAALFKTFAPGHAAKFASITRDTALTQTRRRAELQLVVDNEVRTYDFRFEAQGPDVTAVGFDITPSKLAEASLRDADRRKDEFLATLSHELRNPLTPLKVALDVARLTDDPEQLRLTRGIMERQVAQLGKLVDDLLDLSRITQGRITLEPRAVPCPELFEQALEAIRPQVTQRRQELHVVLPETPVQVMGDRSRLIQVLTNLLGNAVKFTPEGGRIDLIAEIDLALGIVRFRVRDTGIGIAKEMLGRVFEIFVQCRDENSRSQGGLGIGLNVVRRLVELQGGTVSAHSEGEGKGSEFVVELALAGVP